MLDIKSFHYKGNDHYLSRYIKFITNILNHRNNIKFDDSESHHIIPRSMGGNDDKSNLLFLSYREHFIAHLMLAKAFPKHYVVTALALLSKHAEIRNSRFFAIARKNALSNCFLGENNPMYESARFGELNPMFGKTHSEKTRKLISEQIKHWHLTHDNAFKGKTHSEETRRKISERNKISLKGRVFSDSHKQKLKEQKLGAGNPRSVEINCFHEDGTFFKTFPCLSAATKELGISKGKIQTSLKTQKIQKGYYFVRA